jgi:hypothetical protein
MRRIFAADMELLDNRVRDVAKQAGTVPLRGKLKIRSSSISNRSEYDYGEEWDVEHFKLVGECFVEGLMYGLGQMYGRAKLVVLH